MAAALLPTSTAAVGVRPRHVAHVLPRVAERLWAVTRSGLVRFFTHSRLWEISLDTLPTGQARSRARPGRYHVVRGTLLTAPRLWEIALGTLPTSSGVVPGSPVLLPGPLGTRPVSSRLLPAPVLHTVIPIHQAATLLRLVANAGQVASNTSLLGWVGVRSPSPFGERIARLRERHGPPAGHPDSAGDSIHPHALLLNGDSSPTLSGYQRLDFSRGGSLFRLPPTAANLR